MTLALERLQQVVPSTILTPARDAALRASFVGAQFWARQLGDATTERLLLAAQVIVDAAPAAAEHIQHAVRVERDIARSHINEHFPSDEHQAPPAVQAAREALLEAARVAEKRVAFPTLPEDTRWLRSRELMVVRRLVALAAESAGAHLRGRDAARLHELPEGLATPLMTSLVADLTNLQGHLASEGHVLAYSEHLIGSVARGAIRKAVERLVAQETDPIVRSRLELVERRIGETRDAVNPVEAPLPPNSNRAYFHMVQALDHIAQWDDGPDVTDGFENPAFSRRARAALPHDERAYAVERHLPEWTRAGLVPGTPEAEVRARAEHPDWVAPADALGRIRDAMANAYVQLAFDVAARTITHDSVLAPDADETVVPVPERGYLLIARFPDADNPSTEGSDTYVYVADSKFDLDHALKTAFFWMEPETASSARVFDLATGVELPVEVKREVACVTDRAGTVPRVLPDVPHRAPASAGRVGTDADFAIAEELLHAKGFAETMRECDAAEVGVVGRAPRIGPEDAACAHPSVAPAGAPLRAEA